MAWELTAKDPDRPFDSTVAISKFCPTSDIRLPELPPSNQPFKRKRLGRLHGDD